MDAIEVRVGGVWSLLPEEWKCDLPQALHYTVVWRISYRRRHALVLEVHLANKEYET